MPRKYERKPGVVPRVINWSEETLAQAFEELNKKEKSINEVSRMYGIPSRTLRRRYKTKDLQLITLGKYPVLGFENEKRFVNNLIKLGDAGFPPNKTDIRRLAYQFAEKLRFKHTFNHETQMAGPQWLKGFLERNPEITSREAEGLSLERSKDINSEVAECFAILTAILTENDLLDKPDRIFNMYETGIQLSYKAGNSLAATGSPTSGEREETITVVASCNAIGNFLPPVLISKDVDKKSDFVERLPPGSKVYMHKKSADITPDLFYKWFTEHFIFRKPQGKVLLILDDHSSHSSSDNILKAAWDNDVILLCLPSHTIFDLQPLERSVFGPFKKYYYAETSQYMRIHCKHNQNENNLPAISQLLAEAWTQAATPANAMSGFRSSGIYPVNPNAILNTKFARTDILLDESPRGRESNLQGGQIPSVSGEPAFGERIPESRFLEHVGHSSQTPSTCDQVPSVSKDALSGECAVEFEFVRYVSPNNQG